MGLRLHRRVRLFPGLRLNVSASRRGFTLGLSAGVPGARASINTRGDVHTSVGIPGSGVRYATQHRVPPLAFTDPED
jgi:hypothetical protein